MCKTSVVLNNTLNLRACYFQEPFIPTAMLVSWLETVVVLLIITEVYCCWKWLHIKLLKHLDKKAQILSSRRIGKINNNNSFYLIGCCKMSSCINGSLVSDFIMNYIMTILEKKKSETVQSIRFTCGLHSLKKKIGRNWRNLLISLKS